LIAVLGIAPNHTVPQGWNLIHNCGYFSAEDEKFKIKKLAIKLLVKN
jgi:hypothetical protein